MKKGFFFDVDRKPKPLPKREGCEACGLYKNCNSPRMPVTGEGRLGILAVAEGSGKEEDEQNKQLIGDAGQLFRSKLAPHGLDLDRDFWKTNAVCCRPPHNRMPTSKEIKCCNPRLREAIEKLKPRAIWLMGNAALESFYLDKHFDNLTIGNWIRRKVPDRGTGAWVVPLYHPSYALRNRGNRVIESAYDRDLKQAVDWIEDPPPVFENYESKVVCVKQFGEVSKILQWVDKEAYKPVIFFFDYETTGLKPHRPGHKIVSISFYWKGKAYSFPYQYPGVWDEKQFKWVGARWKIILENPNLKLGAQNLKFEDKWTRRIIGVIPRNWYWDTQVVQHLLDERRKTSGLKFQAFIRWGVYGYDEKIAPYIKAVNGEFNRMAEAPLDDLLLYGGLDSLFENKLYEEQHDYLSLGSNRSIREKCIPLYHEGIKSFCDMEDFGIHIDEKYFDEESKLLEKAIKRLDDYIMSSEEVQLFKEKRKRLPNLGGDDLPDLLFDILKITPPRMTDKNNPSVDEEALEQLAGEVPFVKSLVKKRKYEKTKNTYIAQFTRESVGGVVYPSYNLDTARSGRSSSDSPNFQNIPVRDEEAKKTVRDGIIPTPGNKIAETDYKGIEVCIAGCLTQDPALLAYLNDKSTDMHRDQALELFILKPEQMKPRGSKEWDDRVDKTRFYCKNQWVFPQFYGSYYVTCAMSLWDTLPNLKLGDGEPLLDHLEGEGIRRIDDFTEHLKECERKFWKRFPVFKEWQEEQIDFYCRRGYVENPFGFRRGELSKRNVIINTPIQGTAFHCLLWSINRLMKIRREEGWRTKIPGQIHDSIWSDIYPPEEEHYFDVQRRIMTRDIRRENDWLITPLDIDIEVGSVDESWYYVKKKKEEKNE